MTKVCFITVTKRTKMYLGSLSVSNLFCLILSPMVMLWWCPHNHSSLASKLFPLKIPQVYFHSRQTVVTLFCLLLLAFNNHYMIPLVPVTFSVDFVLSWPLQASLLLQQMSSHTLVPLSSLQKVCCPWFCMARLEASSRCFALVASWLKFQGSVRCYHNPPCLLQHL